MSKSTTFTVKPVNLGPAGALTESAIVAVASASRCFYIGQSNGDMTRVFPDQSESSKIKFYAAPTGSGIMSTLSLSTSTAVRPEISEIYTSPSAFHTVISTSTADTYYVTVDSGSAISIPKLKSHMVTAAAWIDEAVDGAAEVAVGTQAGKIFIVSLEAKKERSVKLVAEIPNERLVDIVVTSNRTACLVSTTTCLYLFSSGVVGKVGFDHIFTSPPVVLFEAPIPSMANRIVLHSDIGGGGSGSMSWLNAVSIVTFKLGPSGSGPGGLQVNLPQIVPHTSSLGLSAASLVALPKKEIEAKLSGSKPKGLVVTDFHYIIQLDSRVVVVSRVSLGPAVASASLSQYGGAIASVYSDGDFNYTFSDKKVFQMLLANEGADVWKHWLKKRNFAMALASTNIPGERAYILRSEADHVLTAVTESTGPTVESIKGACDQASSLYISAMQTAPDLSESWLNDVVTKLGAIDKEALLSFLIARMDLTVSSTESNVEVVQISVLFVYCIHLFVELLTAGADSLDSTRETLYQFVKDRCHSLDSEIVQTMFELFESVGLFTELVAVAELVGDSETAIRVGLQLGDYEGIIARLGSRDSLSASEKDLLVLLSPVLFRFCPQQFVSLLLKQKGLGIEKFLPTLASCGALTRDHRGQVILLLNHWLMRGTNTQGNRDVLNLLIQLTAESDSDGSELAQLIESVHAKAFFDFDFCYRTIRDRSLVKPEVVLLSVSGLHLKAVRKSLVLGNAALAKNCAWRSSSAETRRICSVEVLNALSSKMSVEDVIEFYHESEVLELTDILPILNAKGADNLDPVLDEIKESIKGLQSQSAAVQSEILNYQDALKLIRNDIATKPNTCIVLSYSQKCNICCSLVFSEKFLAFPCGHCFHEECLKEALTKRIVTAKRKEDVEEIINRSCCLCGNDSLLLEQLFEPFIDPAVDAAAIDAWRVS